MTGEGKELDPQGLPADPTLQELRDFLREDTFAYKQAGCRIMEGRAGYGVAEMQLEDHHLNAQGFVMGGAIFTLADYAFAAASVPGHKSSVSLTSTIEFMKATRGSKLTATCTSDLDGRKCGFYTTEVVDDLGVKIARIVTTCYHPV
jgi:acyl-CoA thioesterase